MNQKSLFVCQQCGYESPRWFGKCLECGTWGSGVETVVSAGQSTKGKAQRGEIKKPISLNSIPSKSTSRISTKISELDRVLGGGLVPGQVVLIAGEPGIGKSTLLLQVADKLAGSYKLPAAFLYVSGEESSSQIKIRADRLGIENKNIQLLEETDIDSVTDTISAVLGTSLQGVVVDSIQTMSTSDLSGLAGSVGQVRECAGRVVKIAKQKSIPIFIVGHVTKQGSVAGPSVLMHIVDTVLWFEGDKSLTFRLLRAVKNRFGPTDEVGVFSMEDKGLAAVGDAEKIFLSIKKKNFAGNVTSAIMQGTRPILIEIQSLVVPTKMAFPKRVAQGLDPKRLELLLAVLTRRCSIPFYEQDVFVNIAGGISIKNDPSCDLAIALSCASSFFEKPVPSQTLVVGEVGLLGDVREVVAQDKRLKVAKRLGFTKSVSSNDVNFLQEAIRKYLK